MGRPPVLPPSVLRNGFYIEVRAKGASSGIKIRSDDSETMNSLAAEYKKSKEVVILGEYKAGKWLSAQAAASQTKTRKRK